ncbi:sugar porter family MFS transporter [Mycobacterium haemophilum]|uniref:Major facilitator transporter n=1 Tax=Mycobacterium haemophilum TaxID=29311 RepID=A0A0I9T8R6_9MYCO|nr:sugar porter family MFS transporter [Mycobacterium haemophilum]AKN15987.1 MFS transporter [Mycobacterium haemophilum DSM 44634]KLO25351.1 major facilitator transporter [Mycobacterium haemophilum]KLO33954.1 major facilitator transporter [Mycobacterium haemophilum]KLO35468.1 major facilitator transporter [Mycobacterium haemophilum]KLO42635.1 major facilitator transporter [Mycobacterium haemophilum]
MASHGPIGQSTSTNSGEDLSSVRSAVRVASVAALGGLLFGYDSAVINGAVAAVQDDFHIGNAVLGFAVAAALLGAASGALTAGRLADQLGRIAVMKIAALLFLVSAVGTGLAPNVWIVVVFRIIGGIGVGVASVIAPAYIAETSPPLIRGRLGSLQQLAIVSGIFLSLAADWLLAHLAGGSREHLWLGLQAWRWMFIVMAVPAAAYGALAYTVPESPRYLVATHRIPEARRVLTLLLGQRQLDLVVARIQESLRAEKPPSWRDLRKPTGGLYGIVWVGFGLSIFQQFVGINVIFYYSNVLWEAVGFTESSSFTITVITSVTNILTTLIAIALIDKIGRKPLLLIGSAGMSVTLATMAVIFGAARLIDGKPHLEGAAGPVALIAANLFVVAFGMSWGPVVWVLLGEMFPNRIRAAALGVAAAGQWAANWFITVTFPALRNVLGFAYGFYALCAILSLLFVWRCVAETKGKQLEDMHPEAWHSGKLLQPGVVGGGGEECL